MNSTSSLNASNTATGPRIENCWVGYIVHSPSSVYIWNRTATCIVNIVFALAGTILNSFVLFIFWKSTKLRSKLCYFTIMVLSSVDLSVTAIAQSLLVNSAINEVLRTPKCWYWLANYVAFIQFSAMSFWTLFIASIERYLAIVHPLWHHTNATKRKFKLAFVSCWLLNNVFYVTTLLYRPFSKVMLVAVLMLLSTYIFTFGSMFRVARNRLRTENNKSNTDAEPTNTMTFLRDLKMAKVFFIVVCLLVVCFVPAAVIEALNSSLNELERDSTFTESAQLWAYTLFPMNSTMNCLVFFWGNREMRKEASKFLKQCFTGKRSS